MSSGRDQAPGGSWSGLPPDWNPDSRFDGGDTGCGEMILDLRLHFRPLPPRARVAIRTEDAGAPVEIPAWCRITGHRLIASAHPYYLTEVRDHHPEEG
jgi:tRNA 2-thiouridine synthesizing protein A